MPASGSWVSGRRVPILAGWGLLALFGVLLALQDIRSNDYWWHLRTGQWIVEHERVPLHDPFSYSVEGARWIDIHWLFQLALYGLYSLAGHAGVVLAKAGCLLALGALLAAQGGRFARPAVSWVALAAMAVVVSTRWMPRPELPSFLLLAGELWLLERSRRVSDRWLWAIVPLQLLWVNVHGLFALGLVLCALECGAEALRALHPAARVRPQRARRLALVTAAALGVSFLSPNGVEGALYPLRQLAMAGPESLRDSLGEVAFELQPLLTGAAPVPPLLAVALTALAVGSLMAMVLDRRRLEPADWLQWVAFGWLALAARRNVALFAIVAVPIWVRGWNAWRDAGGGSRAPAWSGAVAAAAVLAGVGWLTDELRRDAYYPRLNASRQLGLGVVESFAASDAFAWIARERPPGPIAHGLDAGGPMIWWLHPDYRVLIDGRLEVYGGEALLRHWIRSPEQLERLDEVYHFGSALWLYTRGGADRLIAWLHASPDWRLVHVDHAAVLFVRADADPARFPPLDVRSPALFPPLPDEHGPRDRRRRVAQARLLHAVGEHGRALAEWESALARHPDLPNGRFRLAALQLAARDRHAGLETLRALLADPQSDGPTLASAALLAEGHGQARLAAALRREAQRRGGSDRAIAALRTLSLGAWGPVAAAALGLAGAWLALSAAAPPPARPPAASAAVLASREAKGEPHE